MANADISLSTEGFLGLDYDPQAARFPFLQGAPWPLPMEQTTSQGDSSTRRSVAPVRTAGRGFHQHPAVHSPTYLNDWQIQQPSAPLPYDQGATTLGMQYTGTYGIPFQTSPADFIPATQAPVESGLPMAASYLPIGGPLDNMPFNWQDFQSDLMGFPTADGLPDMELAPQSLPDNSPTDTYLEVRSLTSSSSDNGWAAIEFNRHSYDSAFQDPHTGAIFNPSQTLHNRTLSESSYSDIELQSQQSRHSLGSFVEVPYALHSPDSENNVDLDYNYDYSNLQQHDIDYPGPQTSTAVSPSAVVGPVPIKKPSSQQRSPVFQKLNSPPARRQSRKSPIAKATKPVIRRPSQSTKQDSEKRVGRRRGPLRPDQRKQASEIRKVGACLRCKFLKKTCDKGEPCAGCQPSHARLWQVPCTRIDIRDIGYFVKDWKADYERHISLGLSIGNIKGFSDSERTLFVTHGYGHVLPVKAREIYVRDDKCFGLDWIETVQEEPQQYVVSTARLSAGSEGISVALLSDYLDRHIDGGFENFVDEYFEGTPFLTQMLKTAYRYYVREKLPVIRKALKLVLAYNLTLHVTMVEGIPDEEGFLGKIKDESSKFRGKTMAPVMINFEIKCKMADMWRELQKDILEELSTLYSKVYSGDKLKNWPTIFMLASILLAVWEEMQFDCHYRVPDTVAVQKFCNDMETTPVGVIVGLFQAISQKLPAFNEWDSRKHHNLLNSNPAVCDAMTEVRDHVTRYDSYLRGRANSTFDRKDFDCLSNKFVSKLVIRAN